MKLRTVKHCTSCINKAIHAGYFGNKRIGKSSVADNKKIGLLCKRGTLFFTGDYPFIILKVDICNFMRKLYYRKDVEFFSIGYQVGLYFLSTWPLCKMLWHWKIRKVIRILGVLRSNPGIPA